MELGGASGASAIVFGVAGLAALVSAAGVAATSRNQIRAALGTLVFFGSLATLCAQQGAGFVAALQLVFGTGLVVAASVFGGAAVALRGEPIPRASRFRTASLVVLGALLAGGVTGVALAIGESVAVAAPIDPTATSAISVARALFEQATGALVVMGLLLMTGRVAGLALVREVDR